MVASRLFPESIVSLNDHAVLIADERSRVMEYWWHGNNGRTELTEEKRAHVLQSTQQIPSGLELDRTRFSTLTAQELPDGASA